jgi:hypothetical protein
MKNLCVIQHLKNKPDGLTELPMKLERQKDPEEENEDEEEEQTDELGAR